jgi:nucleoside-diphosphate-sugar epimerase
MTLHGRKCAGETLKRALITGAAGFIGAHLTARLVEQGVEVVAIDNLSWGHAEKIESLPNVKLIRGDVRSIGDWTSEIGEITHVFHLAALISAYDSLEKPDEYIDCNVMGLLRLLELLKTQQSPRLVFASTSGIYGNSAKATKSEGDLPQPTTVYATTKLAGEQLLAMYRSRLGFDDVSLRFFNVFGPGQSTTHPYANVTCRFAHAAARGLGVQLYGDGQQTRDFIYVDDVVDAMLLVAAQPTQRRVYNVGTGQAASIGGLLETVQRLAQKPVAVERLPPWPNDIRDIRADMSLLSAELGFRAKVSMQDGLARTVRAFQDEDEASAQ